MDLRWEKALMQRGEKKQQGAAAARVVPMRAVVGTNESNITEGERFGSLGVMNLEESSTQLLLEYNGFVYSYCVRNLTFM